MGAAVGCWRGLPVLLACAVLLVGCEGDSTAETPPTVSESSTTVGPTDNTPSTPVEPTLPAEAEGSSRESAKAFVRYYVDLLNYALNTGLLASLRANSSQDCSGCYDYFDFVESIYQHDGFYRSSGWDIKRIRLTAIPAEELVFEVIARTTKVSYRLGAAKPLQTGDPERLAFSMAVSEGGGLWQLEQIIP